MPDNNAFLANLFFGYLIAVALYADLPIDPTQVAWATARPWLQLLAGFALSFIAARVFYLILGARLMGFGGHK